MGKWRPYIARDIYGRRQVSLMKPWQFRKDAQAHWTVKCKFCGLENAIRWGTTPKGSIRFMCRSCGRTFVDNNAPPGMRFPVDVIASAINHFYEGQSLNQVRRGLQEDFGSQPDHSNIYRWIVRYSRLAIDALDDVTVDVGDTWVCDETVLKLKEGGGINVWFFDCIDDDTRFLLASHLTLSRYTRDAQTLMERAERRAGKSPKLVITDKLRSYLDAIERTFGAASKHYQSGPFALDHSTRAIERFHGTLKDRTKVMRALANRESARLAMNGWLCHYNFFRPHPGLGDKTPAEAAGATDIPFKGWKDVVMGGRASENPSTPVRVKLIRPAPPDWPYRED